MEIKRGKKPKGNNEEAILVETTNEFIQTLAGMVFYTRTKATPRWIKTAQYTALMIERNYKNYADGKVKQIKTSPFILWENDPAYKKWVELEVENATEIRNYNISFTTIVSIVTNLSKFWSWKSKQLPVLEQDKQIEDYEKILEHKRKEALDEQEKQ